MEAEKNFAIIGNQNAVTYKEIFPLIRDNQIWWGASDCIRWFIISDNVDMKYKFNDNGERIAEGARSRWFTNLEHGKRHHPLDLMTMEENIMYSKHKEVKGKEYYHYDNYDAIEVPFSDAIPINYEGIMGVPITFLDKYCPEQFDIMGMCENEDLYSLKTKKYTSEECKNAYFAKFGKKGTYDLNASGVLVINGRYEKVYQRILIRKKQ